MSIEHTPHGEIWRTDFPPERYFSEPIAEAYDADELHRLATGLPRIIGGAETQISRLLNEPITMQALIDIADPATVTSRLPVVAVQQARQMLEQLESLLSSSGWVHDTTIPAHPGTMPLPLSQARERVGVLEQQVARVTGAFAPRTSTGRRGAQ